MPWAKNGHVATDFLSDGVEITEEEYLSAITGIIDGKSISIDGGFRLVEPQPEERPEPEPQTLDDIKTTTKSAIDTAAEFERSKYITAGSGQAMTYMQKAAEAARCLSVDTPDEAEYPLLMAEVGITSSTLLGVAAVVNAAFSQWQIIGGGIEAARLSAKAAVADAQSTEEVLAIFEGIVWPGD
jgi:hypothetical protein